MEALILEIKAGEGGEDSRLFARDMVKMYDLYCSRQGMVMEYL